MGSSSSSSTGPFRAVSEARESTTGPEAPQGGAGPARVRRVERSRGRAGCIDYQFAQSLVDPCEILLMEKWASQGDLDAHMAIPDPEFSEVLASVRIRSVHISVCEAGEERVMMER